MDVCSGTMQWNGTWALKTYQMTLPYVTRASEIKLFCYEA